MPLPGWNKEAVLLSPAQFISHSFFFSDRSNAFTLDDMVDGAACVTMGLRSLPRRQPLYPTADRRHRRSAGERIGIFEKETVTGIRLCRGCDLFQRRPGIAPLVCVRQCSIA